MKRIENRLQDTIKFDYVNWKGEKSERFAMVSCIYYGSTDYHAYQQWLVKCYDLNKKDWRTFALKDMSNVVNL